MRTRGSSSREDGSANREDSSSSRNDTEDVFIKSMQTYLKNFQPPYSVKTYFDLYYEFTLTDQDNANYKSVWGRRFETACSEENIKDEDIVDLQPNYKTWVKDIKKYGTSTNVPSTANKKSKATKNILTEGSNSNQLTQQQIDNYHSDYANMDDNNKLKIGRFYIEDIMYKEGKEMTHEYPLHSWIYNPEDLYWENYMNADELAELRKYPSLPANEELTSFLDSLEEIVDLEELKAKLDQQNFNWSSQVELYWAKMTLEEFLFMYKCDAVNDLNSKGLKKDLIVRFWSRFDSLFNSAGFFCTRPETPCIATDSIVNNYTVTGSLVPNKFACPRPDHIILKSNYEFAIGECGVDDKKDINLKEEYEAKLKVPKDLNNMLKRLIIKLNNSELSSQLRVVGHIQNHLRLNTVIMDKPGGYANRTLYLDEVKIPVKVEEIWNDLTSVIEVAWISKAVVCNTYNVVFGGNRKKKIGYKESHIKRESTSGINNMKQFKKRKSTNNTTEEYEA